MRRTEPPLSARFNYLIKLKKEAPEPLCGKERFLLFVPGLSGFLLHFILFRLLKVGGKAVFIAIHRYYGAGSRVARNYDACSQRFHLGLQKALKRTRAVYRVIAVIYDIGLGFVAQCDIQLLFGKAFSEILKLKLKDPADILLRKRLIEHYLVKTVKEFGAEAALKQLAYLAARRLGYFAVL